MAFHRSVRTRLLATDLAGSALAAKASGPRCSGHYTPFGHCAPGQQAMGFCGVFRERYGLYQLGHGYRVYAPSLLRFNRPDASSPHGEGGLNAYSYCAAEPINRQDPSGRSFFSNLLGRVKGLYRSRRSFRTGRKYGDLYSLGGGVFAFEHKPRVVTILAHGNVGIIGLNGKPTGAKQAYAWLKESAVLQQSGLLDDPKAFRIMSCLSAVPDEHGMSFAQGFAKESGNPTKGYPYKAFVRHEFTGIFEHAKLPGTFYGALPMMSGDAHERFYASKTFKP